MISKPSTATKPPVVISDSATLSQRTLSKGTEFISLHYLNTTAGVGRVDIYDGIIAPSNLRITLGAAAASGTDDFNPSQNFTFINEPIVVFTTGTGAVTILRN